MLAPDMLESQSNALKTRMIASITKQPWAQQLAPWVGAQGREKLAKKAKTCFDYDVTPRKTLTQNENWFSISTRRLSESVESLNFSLAHSAVELWRCKDLLKSGTSAN